MKAESGRVDYSERAFHQDAHDAMRGDIIRALIETITNSDDAYGESEGKIRVEIEHRRGPWKVITRDRAKGMNALRMKTSFTQLGGRTSGFEQGERVRGNLGRGAKDLAAFGTVVFESICNGRYAKLILKPTGEYELEKEHTAQQEDRDALHIPKNGTVVTIFVDENHRCPQHAKLIEKLSKHFQLRDILSDPRREVQLMDLGKRSTNILRYTQQDLPVVLAEKLPIEGYPNAVAEVKIYRNPERYEDLPSDYRPGGLLLTGRRAIYENTLFRFENNPHAGWFSGRVKCEYIDELANEYDRRLVAHQPQDELNPMPIISRRREDLQRSHPFYKALASAVEKPLGELVAAEERRTREQVCGESPEMRRSLDALGRELARLIDEDLRELDEEGLTESNGSQKQAPPMRLVPENVVIYAGEDKTITLQVRSDLSNGQPVLELDPEGVVELIDGSTVVISAHKNRPDVLTGQIRVRPLVEGEQTILTASYCGHSAAALLEVRPERILDEIAIPPPETLQFERDRYQLAWMRKKCIRLFAPVELVAKEGTNARVESSDPGVVVLGKGISQMILDEDVEYYVAEIAVEARKLGAKATLRARLGATTGACAVVVAREEGGPNLRIKFDSTPAGNFRALIEREGDITWIKIMAEHPAIKRYLGPGPEYPGQNLIASKAIVAEIVAGEGARMVMERKYPLRSGAEQLDAARLYAEHNRYLAKYLARCHKALVPEVVLK